MKGKGPLPALAAAFILVLLGRALDGRWHATHDEFEGASQQLEAHWLVWLGVLATLAVSALALRRGVAAQARPGYLTTFVGCAGYVPVAGWHFIEHANRNDAAAAHVLLVIAQIAIVLGVVLATIGEWRTRRAAEPGPVR